MPVNVGKSSSTLTLRYSGLSGFFSTFLSGPLFFSRPVDLSQSSAAHFHSLRQALTCI